MDLLKQFAEYINNVLDNNEEIPMTIMNATGIVGDKDIIQTLNNYAKLVVSLAYDQFVKNLDEPAPQEPKSEVDYSDIQCPSDASRFWDKIKKESSIDDTILVGREFETRTLYIYTSNPLHLKEILLGHRDILKLVYPRFDVIVVTFGHVFSNDGGVEIFPNDGGSNNE